MITFGVGTLIAVPTQDYLGAAIANPTPVRLGGVQDVSLDADVELKMLYGATKYPIAVGQGKGKVTLKAKYADITPGVVGPLFLGKTGTTSINSAVIDQTGAIPTTPFQITITPPSAGTFGQDLGVTFTATGVQLTRVASAPATGQYSVSGAGVYTFAAADTGLAVKISYRYTATVTGASKFALTNDLMGYTPTFSAVLLGTYSGLNMAVVLNKLVSGKLSLPFKNDDFAISDFEAQAFSDSAGNIGEMSLY